MDFVKNKISGLVTILALPISDERGSFARAFCQKEFQAVGLPTVFEQMNLSKNPFKHTFRGFHFQHDPFAEGKLMRCVSGKIIDYCIDLRPDSETFLEWFGTELSAEKGNMLFVPAGCAHAFLTLSDNTDVFYMATASYNPEAEGGIKFDDPEFDIQYPVEPKHLSEKDLNWPLFNKISYVEEMKESL